MFFYLLWKVFLDDVNCSQKPRILLLWVFACSIETLITPKYGMLQRKQHPETGDWTWGGDSQARRTVENCSQTVRKGQTSQAGGSAAGAVPWTTERRFVYLSRTIPRLASGDTTCRKHVALRWSAPHNTPEWMKMASIVLPGWSGGMGTDLENSFHRPEISWRKR